MRTITAAAVALVALTSVALAECDDATTARNAGPGLGGRTEARNTKAQPAAPIVLAGKPQQAGGQPVGASIKRP